MRLPAFRPRVFYNPQGRYLRCLVRDKLIRATPEETVRQRVLAWLTREKRLAKGQLKLEDNLSYANRSRGRPDISVYDDSGKCRLIVEVKRSEDVAGYDALSQAQRYARRLAVTEVWVTNGDRHSFARRTPSGAWREVWGSRILRAESLGRLKASQIPNPKNKKGVGRYLRLFPEFRALEREKLECLLTLRKLLQQPGHFFKLPYSHNGLHIIADRDMSSLSFQTPGGRHSGNYRIFLVATEGRVETAAVGVNLWWPANAILCVGFLKEDRKHHALQLQLTGCRRQRNGSFDIYHHGMIGGRSMPTQLVFEAIRDYGRDDLLHTDSEGRTRVYLGRLPSFSGMTWRNSRAFLSNLLDYAIIRTNLREGRPYHRDGENGTRVR